MQQLALRKLFSHHPDLHSPPPPILPPDKILLLLWNKILLRRYIEVYRHLLSKCLENAVLGCQEMALPHFCNICWKICESILSSMSLRLRLSFIKWMGFVERSYIMKWVILFTSFCWLWDFLLENVKFLKKSLSCLLERVDEHKNLYAQNNISKKEF